MAEKVVVRLKLTLDSIEELEQALTEAGEIITKSFSATEFEQLGGSYARGRFRIAIVDEERLRRFRFGGKYRHHKSGTRHHHGFGSTE
jgi:hypothetical protein